MLVTAVVAMLVAVAMVVVVCGTRGTVVQSEQHGEWNPALAGSNDAGVGDLSSQPRADSGQFRFGDEVNLVQNDQIGGSKLAQHRGADIVVLGSGADRLGVRNDDQAIEPIRRQAGEMADLHRIGDTGRLDNDLFGRRRPAAERCQGLGKPGADAAADAAVGERQGFTGAGFDQAGVDIDAAEIVDDHAKAAAAGMAQDVVQQRGLAGAEIAAEHREQDLL